MAAESAAATNGVPVVKAPSAATPKPVGELVNLSKRAVDDSEFFADIPPDELLEAMRDDDAPPEPKRARPKLNKDQPPKPSPRRPEPEPEEDEEEDGEPLAADADETPEEATDPEPHAEPESKAWSVPDGKGTKDAPLTLKDLPDGLFVELPINGQKVVVDLKDEAAKGIMRRQAFDQHVSKVKQGLADAHDIAEKAVSSQERIKQDMEHTRQGFQAFIKDPRRVLAALFDQVPDKRRIVEALVEDHEDSYEELSVAYADFRNRENALRENGYAQGRQQRARDREQRRYQREQASLAEERRQIAEDRQRWEQEQASKTKSAQDAERSQAAAKAAFVALKPGLDAGLLALGMTEPTEEMKLEINVRLGVARKLKGGPLTSDDVKQAVIRAGKALDIDPKTPRRPAPVNGSPPPRRDPPRQAQQTGKTGRNFDEMPSSRRVRDLDWYLEG